ncbi:MAG: hypothetical protein LC792_15450 [Actinobacteria bacterium]|nr:hypothetical protein [Actinomycetota bacterium]
MLATNVEVLLAIAKIEGQLSTFIQLMNSQGEQINTLSTDLATLRDRNTTETSAVRDRVTALESAQAATAKATPQWWVWLPALVAVVALFMTLAQQLYGK